MLLSFCFLVLVGVEVSSANEFTDQSMESENSGIYAIQNSGMLPLLRRTRASVSIAVRALKKIFQEATEIRTNSKDYKLFVKKGGLKKAEEDFKSIPSTNVYSHTLMDGKKLMHGEVGDRIVVYTSRSETGQPSIEVVKKNVLKKDKVPLLERIFYDD